ncbi:lytic transglycosylase domain-containing protein [Microbacterium sp. NPDC089698]|uniref:lytic transglycosylase domain-containing protein n=1 Tax=Microbacterium sp. NPDC089698 TaxID=3364200 RepID=UPI00382ABA52
MTRAAQVVTRLAVVLGVLVIAAAAVILLQLAGAETPAEATTATRAPAPGVGQAPRSGATTDAESTTRRAVDAGWLTRTAASTGIPERALAAYASADLIVSAEDPSCGIGWNTLAGIGLIETDHGRHGGAVLGADGRPDPPIRGAALDGNGVMAIPDTDGGAWDGDTVWDRAVGPMQFIPETWRTWGADGDGDGVADPNQIDDAALAAARYLCASGSVATPEGWRRAILRYNDLDQYVADVARAANGYAAAAR